MSKIKKLPKNTFYCEKCNHPCMIYKKGKNHRVLVCPDCGVLATNGLAGKGLKRLGKAVIGEVPFASTLIEGAGFVGDIKRNKKEKKTTSETPFVKMESGEPSKSERIINQELYGVR